MKKLVIGLLLSLASCARAAESAVLTDWQKAVRDSDIRTLKKLLLESKGKVPTDQNLVARAADALPRILTYLIFGVRRYRLSVANQAAILREPMKKDYGQIAPLALFANRGRGDECSKIMRQGVSPYEAVVVYPDEPQCLNLFEYLIASGNYGNIHELQEAAKEIGFMDAPEKVAVLPAALLTEDGKEYCALRYVLRHNLFNAQERVDEFWPTLNDQTLLHQAVTFLDDQNAALVAGLLLVHKANPNLKHEKTGVTALHLAMLNNKPIVEQVLKAHGADDSIPDKQGNTPKDFADVRARAKALGADIEEFKKYVGNPGCEA